MSDPQTAKYVLTCPGCQKRFQLLNDTIFGKRATCKSCKAPFIVDGSVLTRFEPEDLPKPKETPLVVEPIVISSDVKTLPPTHPSADFLDFVFELARNVRKGMVKPVLIVSLLVILVLMLAVSEWESNGRYFLGMWTLQTLLLGILPFVFGIKKPWRIGFFVLIPLLWIYTARNAQVKRRWKDNETWYIDSEWRYSGNVFHQYHSEKDALGLSAEGGVSESGKKHGKWTYTILKPFRNEEHYYWYGDKVTEGEFRLRSK
jgi:hypothetical protein